MKAWNKCDPKDQTIREFCYSLNCEEKLKEFAPLFNPRSVAIIGASRTIGRGGNILVENLMKFGFRGAIYPINPSTEEILGLKAYPNIESVPGTVDLAVLNVPAKMTPQVVAECARKRVKYLLIIAGGFAEAGNAGKELQSTIVQKARVGGTRIIGPNIIGMISTESNLLLTFAPFEAVRKGHIGIIAQTGAFCGAALHYFLSFPDFKLSKSVDLGNQCDLSESEVLEYMMCDPETHVIMLHMEGLRDGRRFLETAKLVSRKKPIVALKFGRTEVATKAIASHTAALAGNDNVYSAAFRQAGVVRVDDVDEAMYVARALSICPLPIGNRVCVITFSGGAGAQAADLCYENDLTVPQLDERTLSEIKALSPPWMTITNPLDIWPAGEKSGDIGNTYAQAIRLAQTDANADAIMALINISYTPITQSPEPERLAQAIGQLLKKPILVSAIGSTKDLEHYTQALEKIRIPVYPTVKSCVLALGGLWKYSRYRNQTKDLYA